MRCIGTLEFVSDFHNKCHETQRQLLLAKECSRKLVKDEIKTDSESDKENISPCSNEESNEHLSCTSAQSKKRSTCLEKKSERLKKIEYKDSDFKDDAILGSDNVENSEGCSDVVWLNKIKPNLLATEICKKTTDRDGQKKLSTIHLARRKRGRKSSGSAITNGKLRKSEKIVSLVNLEKNEPIGSSASQAGAIKNPKNSFDLSKPEEVNTSQCPQGQFLSLPKGVSPNMVKTENLESNNVLVGAAARADGLARVLKDDVVLTPDESQQTEGRKSTAKSPRPADEAGGTRDQNCEIIGEQAANATSKVISMEDHRLGMKSSLECSMVRKTVIKSVKRDKILGGCLTTDNESGTKLALSNNDAPHETNESALIDKPESFRRSATPPGDSLCIVFEQLNESKEGSVGNFRDRRKNSEGQFGKLSELITNEQKEIIEALYTVNMSVVNEEEVYKNIQILDKINVKCEICGKTYPRMDKCQVHVWGHLNMKPYSCKSCDFVTLTISNIRCHIRKRHLKIKPFQCNLCEKSYGTAVLLEEHINSHTGAKPYKCNICDFATSNRQVLSYHKTTHKLVKDISCEVCGKKFFSNCRMRAHMIVHNKDRTLMCKLCSTYLCNTDALEKHYQKVHSRDYVCNICGIRTRSKKALTNHENVHSAAKYRCPICSNVYKSKHMLKEHLLKHQGIRKYKCELCQKSFAQQSHIAAHMSVHMGKRYPCPGCNKMFNRRDNMRIHTRRCKIFKSNPEMKDLWLNRDSTQSVENDGQGSISALEEPAASSAAIESMESLKTDRDELETGLDLIRINLVTDKTEYSNSRNLDEVSCKPKDLVINRSQRFDQFQSEDGEILRIGELEIFPLADSNVAIQNESKTVITENILGPECF